MALLLVLFRGGPGGGARAPLKWRFLFFFAALCFAFVIGQMHSPDELDDRITMLKTGIFYMLFYFLFFHAVRDLRSLRFLLACVMLGFVIVSLHVLRQAHDFGFDTYLESYRGSGPFGSGGGSNMAAAYLVTFLPLFFVAFARLKSRPFLRMLAGAGAMAGVFAVFFTYSRQAYVILAVLLLAYTLRRHLVIGLVVVALLSSYESWAPAGVVKRINMTEQVDASGEKKLDTSTGMRFLLWDGARQMLAEQPWGVGLRDFHRRIGDYVPVMKGYDAHNGYVLVAVETGPQGALALLLIFWGLLRLGMRVARRGGEDGALLGTGFTLCVLGFMLANLFGSRFFDGTVMGNFWILAALAARYDQLSAAQPAPAPVAVPAAPVAPRAFAA